MATAAREGYLPAFLGHEGAGTAPKMLLAQALVGSLISVLFIVEPTVESAFWVLSALLVQLYLMMYIMLFAAAWWLRVKQPHHPRGFRVPGGRPGMAIVCGVGILFALAAFVVGFIPPSSLTELTPLHYLSVLTVGLTISVGTPLLLIRWRIRTRRLG